MRASTWRSGFTLAESLCASIVIGLLAAATLNCVGGAARSRAVTAERSRARQVAGDLMTEVLGQSYEDSLAPTFGPEVGEVWALARVTLDDADDYNGLSESPILLRDGTKMPGATGWSRTTKVEWVSANDPTVVSVSETGLKKVTITVSRGGKTLASVVGLRARSSDSAVQPGKSSAISGVLSAVGATP